MSNEKLGLNRDNAKDGNYCIIKACVLGCCSKESFGCSFIALRAWDLELPSPQTEKSALSSPPLHTSSSGSSASGRSV